MPFPPREGDIPLAELVPKIEEAIAKGARCFVKWTCPACGERVMSDEANTVNTLGYMHTEKEDGTPCGELYTGKLFGMAMMYTFSGEQHD